ncbi:MAG: DsbA family protein [Pseudomonadota bacterium]
MQAVLYYAHDPMCSWCWGFAPVLRRLEAGLPGDVSLQRLLGGLAADTMETMAPQMQARIQSTWRRIAETIPGTQFNFDYWTRCVPRRSTWAACRAVIAARSQGAEYDKRMTSAVQHAYYLEARNPSDRAVLVELARELGLDAARFAADLDSAATCAKLQAEMELCERLRIYSFPALVLVSGAAQWHIPVDYLASAPMLELVEDLTSN